MIYTHPVGWHYSFTLSDLASCSKTWPMKIISEDSGNGPNTGLLTGVGILLDGLAAGQGYRNHNDNWPISQIESQFELSTNRAIQQIYIIGVSQIWLKWRRHKRPFRRSKL